MKIKETEDDLWGSYLTGLGYSGILAILLLLICYTIDDALFDNYFTFIMIGGVCVIFFISGFKKVEENNIGLVRFLGRRDFNQYYSEGYWWIFPLAMFKQKPSIETLNETGDIKLNIVSKDDVLLDINVSYTWQLKDPKLHDKKGHANSIRKKLVFEIGKFIKSRDARELLCDVKISEKMMADFLSTEGEKIGISIVDVYPDIQHGEHFKGIAKEYERKYKELKFQLDQIVLKSSDMQLYQSQIHNCIKELGFSNVEALNFIKAYKNNVNLNEQTYNLNIGELNNVLELLINLFKSKL